MGKRAEQPRGAARGSAEIAALCSGSCSGGVSDKPFIIIIRGYYYQLLICSGSQGTFIFFAYLAINTVCSTWVEFGC